MHASSLGSCAFARRYSRSRLLSFFSSGYLDVSVPPVGPRSLWIQLRVTGHDPCRVFPLGDLGVLAWLAARPSFSQLPHVRPRLLAPKHPPCTLGSLTMFSHSPSLLRSLFLLWLHWLCFRSSQDPGRLRFFPLPLPSPTLPLLPTLPDEPGHEIWPPRIPQDPCLHFPSFQRARGLSDGRFGRSRSLRARRCDRRGRRILAPFRKTTGCQKSAQPRSPSPIRSRAAKAAPRSRERINSRS